MKGIMGLWLLETRGDQRREDMTGQRGFDERSRGEMRWENNKWDKMRGEETKRRFEERSGNEKKNKWDLKRGEELRWEESKHEETKLYLKKGGDETKNESREYKMRLEEWRQEERDETWEEKIKRDMSRVQEIRGDKCKRDKTRHAWRRHKRGV